MFRILITAVLAFTSLASYAATLPCAVETKRQVAASYLANDGKTVEACFDLDRKNVTLRLPDLSVVTLPAAISGSGARYSDGKLTFWEHQGAGRYFSGETLVFEGMVKQHNAYDSGVRSTVLTKTNITSNGARISYPVTDKAEVTAAIVEIAPGVETGWHRHSIPVYAYMLSGELEVTPEGGKPVIYKEGNAIIEMVNAFHNGRNTGKVPARLVVFYTGVQGVPNAVKK